VPEQQLDGAQVAGTPVNQGRLGSTQKVRSEQQGVQSDVVDPAVGAIGERSPDAAVRAHMARDFAAFSGI